MGEWIVRKWNWNNGTDFANWISGEITDKVLAEIGELSFEGLPLPTLDTKFYICGKEFEVRDALSHATHEVWHVAREVPDCPDGWRTPDVACTDGVKEFADGFFCGVVRGMLN